MGFNINELNTLAGGGAQGFRQGVDTRISMNEEARKQTAENERRAAYEEMEKLKGLLGELPGLMDPSQAAQAGYIPPAAAQTGAAPEAVPTAPPQAAAGPQTFAMNPPAEPPSGQPPQGAGTGKFGDDVSNGSALPGAAPAPAPQGGGKEMALPAMEVGGTPDKAGPRDRLQDWKTRAMSAAARIGGVQAMDQVEKYYQMAVRGQMYDYAAEGIRALADGSAGNAAKMLNTAMEIAPVDPELEFFAMNGELYGQRGDSEPRKYTQEDVVGLTEHYIMDDENYMEWQKFGLEERRAGIADRATAVQEGYLGIAQDKAPAELSKMGAEIYSLLRNADANAARAAADGTPGLDDTMIRNINNDIPTLMQNAKIDPGSQWWGAMATNPAVAGAMQSAAIDIAKHNLLGQGNYADAISLAAFAFAPAAGIEPPKNMSIGGIGVDEQGMPYAVWNKKPLYITPETYAALNMQLQGLTPSGSKK